MPLSFLPEAIYPSLTAISPEKLLADGIQLLMLDFDNTILPYTADVATAPMCAWLKTAQASKLQLCVVSNSKNARVVVFCEKNGLDCVTRAKKPFPRGIRECLSRYGIVPREAALVGDQIYTDVLGANFAGVRALLIPAIHNHTVWLKLRHIVELPFIWLARRRRVL